MGEIDSETRSWEGRVKERGNVQQWECAKFYCLLPSMLHLLRGRYKETNIRIFSYVYDNIFIVFHGVIPAILVISVNYTADLFATFDSMIRVF